MTTAVQVQIRRDTSANLATATPAAGEIAGDMTRSRMAFGDGASAGGIPHAKLTDAQGYGFIANCALAASAASNNLTIALKNAAGNDSSAANSIYVPFRTAPASTSSEKPSFVEITSALSITIGAGDTLGTANNVPFRIWVVLYNNGGTPVLGAIVCLLGGATPSGAYWLDESQLVSPTSTIGNSAGTFYSAATVAANSAFRILGYVEFGSGLATAGTYNAAPTKIQLFGPGVHKPGDIIQRTPVSSSTTQAGTANTTYTALGPTQSISLTSAANLAEVTIWGTTAVSGSTGELTIGRGSTPIGIPMTVLSADNLAFKAIDAPGTTASTTYGVLAKQFSGSFTVYWPYSATFPSGASIQVEEIMT